MKIAIMGIKGLPAFGGAERVVEAVVTRLAQNHEFIIYCSMHHTPQNYHCPGIKLIRLPCLSGKYSHMLTFNFMAALHALLFGRYDIVHLHHVEACYVLPLIKLRYRIIATNHGRITKGNKWGKLAAVLMQSMEFFYIYFANGRTCVSSQLTNELQKRYREKIFYIANGVEKKISYNLSKAEEILEEAGSNGVPFIAFAAARILPLKGLHILLQALQGDLSKYKLIVIGDLSIDQSYAHEIKNMSQDNVIFIPLIKDKEILFAILKKCEFFVFPSQNEANSIMLLEVAALGIPIVCSDIPANTYTLGNNALYFISGDCLDLREKVQWALVHKREMIHLAEKAQIYVCEHFNWDSIAAEYDHLYSAISQQ